MTKKVEIEKIWDSYKSELRSFLIKRIDNASDVDDLLQEILIKSFQNLQNLNNTASLRSWLYQIANRSVVDFYRKKGMEGKYADEKFWYDEQDINIKSELAHCIIPFLSRLNDQSAELITRIDLNGESQKDYAAKLGISYSTLKSQVQHARTQLKDVFDSCCSFNLDQQGNLVDYEEKSNQCKKC